MDTPIDVDDDNQWKHDSEFVKITKNMSDTCLYSIFTRNRLRMVSYMSEACSSTSTTSTRLSPTSGYVIFSNTHGTCYISYFSREIGYTHLEGSGWFTLSTLISMTWRPPTYLRPFPIFFSWKIGYKTCAMCVFESMTYPLVGLGLVGIVDVDEHNL